MKYNKIFFILILVLFLVGCGGSKPEPETPEPENPGIEDPENPGVEEPEQPKEVVFETDEEYIELGIYEKHELNITIENIEDYELEYEVDTEGIIEIDNGIIEAIEYPNKRFIIGVQWHPELMINYDDIMKKLFDRFIDEAKKNEKIGVYL
jgi:hypothetical protein